MHIPSPIKEQFFGLGNVVIRDTPHQREIKLNENPDQNKNA